jgi:NAD(P)-dependent dehydrogenase (short-subunit alcohol dehydrogenase family)
MNLNLKDKLALVSGSTAGIGYAIAAALASEGAKVIINGRLQRSVDAAVAKLQAATGGKVIGFAGDLSIASVAERLAQEYPNVEI